MASPVTNFQAIQQIHQDLHYIPPPDVHRSEEEIRKKFSTYTVADLKRYLGERRVKTEGTKQELATLAFWAWKCNIPKNPSGNNNK